MSDEPVVGGGCLVVEKHILLAKGTWKPWVKIVVPSVEVSWFLVISGKGASLDSCGDQHKHCNEKQLLS